MEHINCLNGRFMGVIEGQANYYKRTLHTMWVIFNALQAIIDDNDDGPHYLCKVLQATIFTYSDVRASANLFKSQVLTKTKNVFSTIMNSKVQFGNFIHAI